MEMKYGSAAINAVKYCDAQGVLHDVSAIWRNGMTVWPSKPLTFTAETAGSTLYLLKSNASAPDVTLEYSTDGMTWSSFVTSATAGECTTITLANVGDKVMLRAGAGGNTTFAAYIGTRTRYHQFVMTGSIAASGNIQSILDANMNKTDVGDYCFLGMFYGCTSLTAAPALPATTLAGSCYSSMFRDCTSLTAAPALPATTLADYCYQYMFNGCTSLTTAPALPATTLAGYCYSRMFYGCTNLKISENGGVGNVILNIPSGTTEPSSWNSRMFVNTGGTFTGNPSVGTAYYCYQ